MKKLLQTTGLTFALFLLANVGMAQTYTLSPENGATGVSTSPTLTITFNDNVELVKGGFIYLVNNDWSEEYQFNTGAGKNSIPSVGLSVSGKTLTLILLEAEIVLTENTQYSIFTEEGSIKVGGISWDDLYDPDYETSIWSFTTAAAVAGPEIISVTPLNGTTDVPINPTLTVEFDIDISKGSSGYFTIMNGEVEAETFSTNSGKVDFFENILTINDFKLDYNTTYHILIDEGFIENFDGISDPAYWTFTTETAPPQWAVNYPTLTQSPTGFTFTGKTDLAGIYYFVVTNSSNKPTPAQIIAGKSASGNAALKNFNELIEANEEFSKTMPFSPLLLEKPYSLHVVVKSDDGKFSDVITIDFDRFAPFIYDSNPTNGYTLFQVEDSITIVFSEKVFDYNGGVISSLSEASFTLKTGDDIVPFVFSVSDNGQEVTLKPLESLIENTNYEVVIDSLSDVCYNVMPTVTRTFQTDFTNIWIGAISDSWTDNDNWQVPYVSGKSVLIPLTSSSYPVIDTDITVNNFTIEAGAVVTQSGGLITVLGDFDLLSSEVTNASYLPKGGTLDVKGETRVHQHIVPGLGTTVVYLMGTPTLGATNYNVGTEYKIKKYDNRTDSWPKIDADLMEPGVGYSVYAENDLVFRGDINRVATTHDLIRTNGQGYGWNVMGNPFTAGMKWGDLDIDTAKVENSYWIWNPQDKVYGAFNQEAGIGVGNLDGTIPSNHGFLVKLKIGETSGSITFDPKAMVVNNDNYLKSATKSKPHMKISAGDGNFTDQLAIAFVPDAAQGIDKYDTEKFFGSGNPFQIFTVEGAMRLSINSLPDAENEVTVNLGYRSSQVGSYTIQLSEDHLEHSEVLLTDLKEGITVDLLHDGSYTFNVDRRETNSSRFTLTFPERVSTLIKKIIPLDDMTVYLKDGDVIVDILRETGPLTYELLGVSGNIVRRGHLYSGVNNLGKFPSGLYIINTRNDEGTIVSKKLLVTR